MNYEVYAKQRIQDSGMSVVSNKGLLGRKRYVVDDDYNNAIQ